MADKKTILIVDDQESIIKALKRLLLPEPYNILSSPNGPAALELIKNRKDYDEIFLIISDQRMPHMTGVEFLKQTVEILPDTIRFILTGYTDTHNIENAMKKGIVHRYITKPWNNNELLIMISQAYQYPEKLIKVVRSDVNTLSESRELNIIEKEIREFNQRSKDKSLGRMALYHGFINQEQLEASMTAMQVERQAGRQVALENILSEKGFISSDEIGKLVAATRRKLGKSFGAIAVKDYGVKALDIAKALATQSEEFANTSVCRLLGDILVAEKILTEDQKDSIIIDMTYLEKEELTSDDSGNVEHQSGTNQISDKLILNKKKKNFFRQRAFDKIFCKSVINKNFATEAEVLKGLEEQLIHFTKTFEVKLIKDILIERSVISQEHAKFIADQKSLISPQKFENQTNPSTTTTTNTNNNKIITTCENSPFQLTVSDDELEATIEIIGDIPKDMVVDKLKTLLAKYQIVYGLADDVAIELFLKGSDREKKSFLIAKGKPVKEGRNAMVRFFFKDHSADFGKELESGKFDYRERGEMVNITQGTILAEKIPLIPAINGINVKGYEIAASTPLDIMLDCGKGAEISKDGLKVIATANGRPDLSLGGKITVLPEIVIKGDVDFKTGNIKFSGDVTVNGTILQGFSVTANNLTVSDIEEGDVNIFNTLLVKNSINSSKVKTGGQLAAQIIKNSTIIARGDVIVQKEIIDSTITTSGKVILPKGRIIATTIHAAKGIFAMNIGNDVSTPCHLFPNSDEHALDIIKSFNEKIDHQREILVKLEAFKAQYEQENWRQLTNLSEASKVQEQLAIEKKNILKQLHIYESKTVLNKSATNDNLKQQLTKSLSGVDNKILQMDETINKLFDEHDTTQNKVIEIKVKIKDVEQQMQILLNEKERFEKWYETEKNEARKEGVGIYVQGTIFARTQITCSESSIILNNNIRNSKIYQTVNNKDPSNPFYEMRIDSLASKSNQPHVYRT
ncbi:MAG: DUF342 domain-containing protein [Desulfamplus sp.]|nr:DUF342 domain-containing protein [Desulfamplus sp.]